MVNNTLNS